MVAWSSVCVQKCFLAGFGYKAFSGLCSCLLTVSFRELCEMDRNASASQQWTQPATKTTQY